jgi:hypothetical protein
VTVIDRRLPRKDIDLFAVMKRRRPRVSLLAVALPLLGLPALAALVALGVLWLDGQVTTLNAERDGLRGYVEGRRLEDSRRRTGELRAQAEEMRLRADEVTGTLYSLSSYPDLTGTAIEAVHSLAGTDNELSGIVYNRRTGILNFTVVTEQLHAAPAFVQGLRKCGIFSDVQYTGYAHNARTTIDRDESGRTGAAAPTGGENRATVTGSRHEVDEYHYAVTCQVAKPQALLPPLPQDAPEGIR